MAKKAAKAPAKVAKKTPAKAGKPLKPDADGVVRLSGGNPQIAKGEGDEVVQAFIAAMPGWTKGIGEKIDSVVGRVVPKAAKAVKWNTPLYGFGDGTWFLAFHVYAKYVKVTFFRGEQMTPIPPETSKVKGVRYLHIREGEFDEKQFAAWVKQASKLPGEKM
ncbi:MAG: DUF1801 domain-containing protein [Hyphomonadaceae bacterium]|nr:DUF1801 domain-containing protein [Hyphomonadaceae bacterium]